MEIMMNLSKAFIMIAALIFLPALLWAQSRPTDEAYAERRQEMVDRQIRARGVNDRRVLAAMLKVPRHLFVPDELQDMSYEDTPLPIRFDQTISQPYIVAFMTEALKLGPADKVLEVGTGSGYQAAILAELAGEVYSIEIVRPLGEQAAGRLEKMGYKNVHVRIGDGSKGWPEEAPFDAIIATAAPGDIPETLVKQLKPGGRMVIPVGTIFQELFLITKTKDGYDKKALLPVKFVPMVTPYEHKNKPKPDSSGSEGLFK